MSDFALVAARQAKQAIERFDELGWPHDPVLSRTLDHLKLLIEHRAGRWGRGSGGCMPPVARAIALLVERSNQRRDDGLPLPCPCRGCCKLHSNAGRCTSTADSRKLIVEAAGP